VNQPENGSFHSARYAGWSTNKNRYEAPDLGDAPGAETGWTWVRDKFNRDKCDGDWGSWQDRLAKVQGRRWRDFSWVAAQPLLDSANDQVAKLVHDLVNDRRQRWIAAQRAAGAAETDFIVSLEDKSSCLILGDPGEADGSQYAVVEPMLAVHRQRGSDFTLILSDVIYPAGDINDYVNAFYIPYEEYDRPVFALPGNHDWYDGLNGFMFHFCGAEPLPDVKFQSSTYTAPERLANSLWRNGARPYRPKLLQYRYDQARFSNKDKAWKPVQPAPYFAIDLCGNVRLVSIDTGIRGTIDREQAEWLIRVSDDPKYVKVLLTGKPIWVDGEYHPCPIEWGSKSPYPKGYETVDDVVRDPTNGYVASIGGDIHNFQRYRVRLTNEPARILEYVVAGGSGAYMSATHRFGRVDNHDREKLQDRDCRIRAQENGKPPPKRIDPPETVEPVTEADFSSYPTRGDSLAYYARSYGRRMAYSGVALLVATAAVLIPLFLWGKGLDTKIGDQEVWNISLAVLGTLLAVAAVVIGMVVINTATPRHFKFPVVVLATPTLTLGTVLLAEQLVGDDWDWVWKVGLLTLGTLLLPIAVILALYYGFGSTGRPSSELVVPRTIALGFLILGEVAIWFPWQHRSASELVLIGCIALVAVAALLFIVSFTAKPRSKIFAYSARRWWLNLPATIVVYGAFVGNVVWRWWDVWEVQVTLVAAGTAVILATIIYWILMFPWGFGAMFGGLWNGRLDPAVAMWWLKENGYRDQAHPRRIAAGEPNRRKQWLCRFLMSRRGRVLVSEVGNADSPPLFKSFLHLEVKGDNGRRKLEILCYGVTGWKAHEDMQGDHVVPVEERIEIDLTAAQNELGDNHRKRDALGATAPAA
jgi:hypothetical protein